MLFLAFMKQAMDNSDAIQNEFLHGTRAASNIVSKDGDFQMYT